VKRKVVAAHTVVCPRIAVSITRLTVGGLLQAFVVAFTRRSLGDEVFRTVIFFLNAAFAKRREVDYTVSAQ